MTSVTPAKKNLAEPESFLSMGIDYDHSANLHNLDGPRAALPKLFPFGLPGSILDVGCGTGTWLRAAIDMGISDVIGIDGVELPEDQLLFPPDKFHCRDLGAPVDLGRRFELVICLEVAEHLDPDAGGILIRTLTRHSDVVVFSAACPGQSGQHHVNCQWPEYWQALFNSEGYACDDSARWTIWDDSLIQFWYRQNIFMARRDADAGRESRIRSVIHPEMHRLKVSGLIV